MNLIDRMELNELRAAMWEMFSRVAKVPEDRTKIEAFIRFMDRHQEIISQDGREVAEEEGRDEE